MVDNPTWCLMPNINSFWRGFPCIPEHLYDVTFPLAIFSTPGCYWESPNRITYLKDGTITSKLHIALWFPAKFNESLLVGNHRQNLHQVNTLLKDLEQTVKLNPVPVPNNSTRRDEEFNSYDNVTDLLKSKILREGVKYQITNYPRTLPAEFLPSPQFDPFDPRLGFSHIFPDAHAPPPGIFQGPPYLNRPIVQNPELRPGPPYSGYLASSVQSLYPRLAYNDWTPRLRENGPGRYVAGFSESPTPVKSTTNIQQVLLKEQPLKSYIPPATPQEYFRSAISTPFFNRARSKSTRFTYPVKTPTMNDNAKIWLEQIAPYTRANKKLKKVSNRHHHRRKKTTVEVHVVQGGYTMSTGTANTADLFVEDEHGFLKVVTPKYVPQPQSVMTTKAGDVLYGSLYSFRFYYKISYCNTTPVIHQLFPADCVPTLSSW